jgi:RHS repeat-associated protein
MGRVTKRALAGNDAFYSLNPAGELATAEDNRSKIQIAHDNLGRQTRVISTNKSANLTNQIDYEYDANGNRTRMVMAANPSPLIWTFSYDSLNRLTNIINPENKSFQYEYDAAGRRIQLTYPNGIEAHYSYDDAGQLMGIAHRRTADQSVLATSAYTYNLAGNRSTLTDAAGTHTYGYDDLHRLTSASHPSNFNAPALNETFSYDAVGNRIADDAVSAYTYDDANRLSSDSRFTYTHDANGNLTRKRENSTGQESVFTYDEGNRLLTAMLPGGTHWDYKYDVFGRRVEKSSGTASSEIVRYVYDGQKIIAMLDGSNQLIAIFTHGPRVDETLSVHTANGADYFLHASALGSVVAHSDGFGNIVETIEYSAYGIPTRLKISASPPVVITESLTRSPFGFAGREYDTETGLYHFRARAYDPTRGAFLQEDPTGDRIQPYAYADDNPINAYDPYGVYSIGEFAEDAANYSAGLGDNISSALTLGFFSTRDARRWLGIGGVDPCSGWYTAGRYSGYAWQAGYIVAGGLNGGSNSVFWSGGRQGAKAEA